MAQARQPRISLFPVATRMPTGKRMMITHQMQRGTAGLPLSLSDSRTLGLATLSIGQSRCEIQTQIKHKPAGQVRRVCHRKEIFLLYLKNYIYAKPVAAVLECPPPKDEGQDPHDALPPRIAYNPARCASCLARRSTAASVARSVFSHVVNWSASVFSSASPVFLRHTCAQ